MPSRDDSRAPASEPEPQRRKSFSIVMLPTTDCDAACEYCFVRQSAQRMPLEVVGTSFERLREYCERCGVDHLEFFWQGGEILLLDPAWFLEVGKLSRNAFSATGISVSHHAQSNLLAYRSEWAGVFHSLFGSSVGTSLDHPNMYRRRKAERAGEYLDRWLEARRLIAADGIELAGVISLPNAESIRIGAGAFYSFYMEFLGLRSLQVNLPYAGGASAGKGRDRVPDPRALASFMRDLIREWERRGDIDTIGLQPFADLRKGIGSLAGPRRRPCVFSACCADSFLSIGPDGSAGLCDCWVASLPEFTFGNIVNESIDRIMQSKARRMFRSRLTWILESSCVRCEYLTLCYGGCPIRTYSATGVLEARDPNCEVYRAVFDALYQTLSSEGEKGKRG